jgi:hypothetical protein
MTMDELVLEIYTDMKKAFTDGNALAYANRLAQRIMTMESPRETVSRVEINIPPTPQPRQVQPLVERREESRDIPTPPTRTNTGNERRDTVGIARL